MAAVFPGLNAPQSCLHWTRRLCVTSGCSAKLASTLTMRVSARGWRSTADLAGVVSSCLSSRVILSSALLAVCAAEDLVHAMGLVVGNEYFTAKELAKPGLM